MTMLGRIKLCFLLVLLTYLNINTISVFAVEENNFNKDEVLLPLPEAHLQKKHKKNKKRKPDSHKKNKRALIPPTDAHLRNNHQKKRKRASNSKIILEKLTSVIYSEEEEDAECPFCLNELLNGDKLVYHTLNKEGSDVHVFHKKCIEDMAAENHHVCLTCQSKVIWKDVPIADLSPALKIDWNNFSEPIVNFFDSQKYLTWKELRNKSKWKTFLDDRKIKLKLKKVKAKATALNENSAYPILITRPRWFNKVIKRKSDIIEHIATQGHPTLKHSEEGLFLQYQMADIISTLNNANSGTILNQLSSAFDSCFAVQGRTISSIHQRLNGTLDFLNYFAQVMDSFKLRVLHMVIEKFNADHIKDNKGLNIHAETAYIALIGKEIGLASVDAAKADQFKMKFVEGSKDLILKTYKEMANKTFDSFIDDIAIVANQNSAQLLTWFNSKGKDPNHYYNDDGIIDKNGAIKILKDLSLIKMVPPSH